MSEINKADNTMPQVMREIFLWWFGPNSDLYLARFPGRCVVHDWLKQGIY